MNRPGDFRALCRMRDRVPEQLMTEAQWAVARAVGFERVFRDMSSGRIDKEAGRRGRWEIAYLSCGGLDTTDRAAFESHMAETHGRKPSTWTTGNARGWRPSSGMWNGPRLTAEGKPWEDRSGRTDTCPDCGLVAEVDKSAASELWWREHLDLCIDAVARRAS